MVTQASKQQLAAANKGAEVKLHQYGKFTKGKNIVVLGATMSAALVAGVASVLVQRRRARVTA